VCELDNISRLLRKFKGNVGDLTGDIQALAAIATSGIGNGLELPVRCLLRGCPH